MNYYLLIYLFYFPSTIFFYQFSLQNIDQKYIPDQNIRNVQPAFVDTNHSQEHSLSFSSRFTRIFRSHTFSFAKFNGSAKHMLCYFQIPLNTEKNIENKILNLSQTTNFKRFQTKFRP